jgi:hypothetical protein
MKKLYFFILAFITTQGVIIGQQNYCDFEGNNVVSFGVCTGIVDSSSVSSMNPQLNPIDSSAHCVKYVRDTAMYDVIRLYPYLKLTDVSTYADSSIGAPKIKMKLYSTAPVGTVVQLQLGIKNVDNYPAGVNSEYIAMTTVQNAWELVTFNYFQSPSGSLAASTQIDKVVILFHPGSNSRDTIYFDDLTGPSLITTAGIQQLNDMPLFKLSQNNPNPAKESTNINFQLNSSGSVSLEIYDMLGNQISSLINQNMKAGNYSVPVETSTMPDGIYFYVLRKDGFSKTTRMIISK